jgi:hypothetical protein
MLEITGNKVVHHILQIGNLKLRDFTQLVQNPAGQGSEFIHSDKTMLEALPLL